MSKCAQSADCGFGQVSFLILGCTCEEDDYGGDGDHGEGDDEDNYDYGDDNDDNGDENDDDHNQPEQNRICLLV